MSVAIGTARTECRMVHALLYNLRDERFVSSNVREIAKNAVNTIEKRFFDSCRSYSEEELKQQQRDFIQFLESLIDNLKKEKGHESRLVGSIMMLEDALDKIRPLFS
jgi:hypothetical protein